MQGWRLGCRRRPDPVRRDGAEMKALRTLPVILMLATVAACNMPRNAPLVPLALNGGPQTWVDAPLDQMRLPLAPYEVVFHGTDEAGVTGLELRINDQLVAVPPPEGGSQKLITARYAWSPAEPGQYVLRARSTNAGGSWSPEAVVTVWVGDIVTPSFTPTFTLTPTITPTVATPTGPLSLQFLGASTDRFYYGDGSCGPTSVAFKVQVSDPARILGVTLFFKLRSKDTDAYTEWNSNYDLKPQGNGALGIELQAGAVAGIKSAENWLIYQFVGTGADHKPNSRSQVYGDITLSRCGSGLIQPGQWQINPWPWIIVDPTPEVPIIK